MISPLLNADASLYGTDTVIDPVLMGDELYEAELAALPYDMRANGVLRDYIMCYKNCRRSGGGRFRCAFACLV